MKLAVVIPVGPGHETYAQDAKDSVRLAWERTHGPFDAIGVACVSDARGELGRSAARNAGVRSMEADWYFFLDADDALMPNAFGLVDLEYPATFGAVCLNGAISADNVFPLVRDDLFRLGAKGTLSMGCFVRGEVAKATPFDESLDAGEDFDFYLRLPGFVKIKESLVSIGYRNPSAGGPRGYETIRWFDVCASIIDRYR